MKLKVMVSMGIKMKEMLLIYHPVMRAIIKMTPKRKRKNVVNFKFEFF
jgi:hypothetical protein